MLYRYKDSCSAEIKTEAPKVLFYGLFCANKDTSRPVYDVFTASNFTPQKFFFYTACFELFGGGNTALYLPAVPVRQQAGLLAVPARPAGGAAAESSGHRQYTLYSWRESSRLIRQNGDSVLLVNVVENWDAVLASPRPWQSPDCIPIVGAVLSL